MTITERIQNDIDTNRVMLFMKGSPEFPMCGFSSQVVEVREKEVDLSCKDGRRVGLPNDHVFALLGGDSPNQFLQKIGISLVTKEISVEGAESDRRV